MAVSMESGLEGRNNVILSAYPHPLYSVSMESGLEGRNNLRLLDGTGERCDDVSMESGLEGRNNDSACHEVRATLDVSMESGLEGRNNQLTARRYEQWWMQSQWSPA